MIVRKAESDDRSAIEAIVRDSYGVYIPRLGKPPGPMLDDYRKLIGDGLVHVLEEGAAVAGIVVLIEKSDHLLLDNVAVAPAVQGRGLGKRLVAFAEAEAARRGFAELRLYTNEVMTENIALYARLGFVETHRGEEAGYRRVYMKKPIAKHPA
jgi:ribosomal protein S18 acetylase RimI-like enzyme